MNRKIWVFCAVAAGLLLAGAAFLLFHGQESGERTGSTELAPFQSIDLSVMSGQVTVTEGDGYSVSYRLHGREKVKQAEVIDDTLVFDTGFDRKWKPTKGNWYVTVTVPAGTEFDTVQLSSTAGDITYSGFDFWDGTFKTTAGEVILSDVMGETLNVKTVSHHISLTDSVISDTAELETVSGKIKVSAPFSTIQAKSVGGITFNGEKQGRKFSIGQESPALTASSVSGDIVIDTQ